jgi:Flp pilus assembly protein TadD
MRSAGNNRMDRDFNKVANSLIAKNRLEEASSVLERATQRMPKGWKPIREDGRFIRIAFWDQEEFFAYVRHSRDTMEKSTLWTDDSYSRAWYILSSLASKQGRLEHAVFCADCGLVLDPDHPELWSQKGVVLGKLKRHEEAFECFSQAATIRGWAPPDQIARALRGKGVQLIDLERLDEAEAALKQSLELEPDSEIARNELDYIEQLRTQRAAASEKIPWFLHSFVNPPTDPLTIQLIALVEDLPSIPGPKTVGAENYHKILDAFMDRGWAGFEEAFDHIVPRNRPDYEQVKRDLLREPIFNVKAHRNTARALAAGTGASEETLEDVINDIFGEREKPKPQ